MVDYNFFEGYKVKRPKSSFGVRLFNIFFLLALVLLAAYMGFNLYLLNVQNRELSELNDKIMEIRSTDDISRITQKQELLEELMTIVANMETAGDDINHSSIIDEDLLVTIADALPSDVRLSVMNISGDSISIRGEAMSKPAIAEFEYNLRQIDSFEGIFINGIQRGEANVFSFDLSLKVGGGTDGN